MFMTVPHYVPHYDAAKPPSGTGAGVREASKRQSKAAKGSQPKAANGSGNNKRQSKPAKPSKQLPLFGNPPKEAS